MKWMNRETQSGNGYEEENWEEKRIAKNLDDFWSPHKDVKSFNSFYLFLYYVIVGGGYAGKGSNVCQLRWRLLFNGNFYWNWCPFTPRGRNELKRKRLKGIGLRRDSSFPFSLCRENDGWLPDIRRSTYIMQKLLLPWKVLETERPTQTQYKER